MLTVAGLVPFTTIDFPERLAAVIFFQGCPLKCPFCHNPNLQPAQSETPLTTSWEDVVTFLTARKKRLDGVVFSGGEPLLQPDIDEAVKQIKDLGFQTALHTSGVYPEKLKTLLPLLSWVGLDIKAPTTKYDLLTGRKGLSAPVHQSLKLLIESGISYEVRTTLDPRYLTVDDIYTLGQELSQAGVRTYTLQKYRTFDLDKNPPQQFEIDSFFNDEKLQTFLKNTFPHFSCR